MLFLPRSRLVSLDLFTGIGGFHLAAQRNGLIYTLMASEIDGFNCKHIYHNLGLENAGSVCDVAVNELSHPAHAMIKEMGDVVPCESTGFTSLTMDDFMEGVVEFPDMVTGGFPCQNISSANVFDLSGIDGEQSGLVHEQLRILENLEVPIAIFENAERLNSKGLSYILSELDRMEYTVEWETISASAFNFPHYRHRLFCVCYRADTEIAKGNVRVFDYVRALAQKLLEKPFIIPLISEDAPWVKENAGIEDARSIKLRTKRINGLGNAVVPDIPEAIFKSITDCECNQVIEQPSFFMCDEQAVLTLDNDVWSDDNNVTVTHMPTRGIMSQGVIYSSGRCDVLNVSKKQYKGLYSTLIKKDGNNNFSCKSRLTRPGKLGGLVGEIMGGTGLSVGGLHPEFCERFMGYPIGYTEVSW
jgi:DNA (cytosine-5)-methyltransferase 1